MLLDKSGSHATITVTTDVAEHFGGLKLDSFGVLRVPVKAVGSTRRAKWGEGAAAPPALPVSSMLRFFMRSDEIIEETSVESVAPTPFRSTTAASAASLARAGARAGDE